MINLTGHLWRSLFLLILIGGAIHSDETRSHDRYGDRLPEGTTARFGSLRWRMPGAIEKVEISPDGKLVAAENMGGKVFVWATASGRLLHVFPCAVDAEACFAFSPDSQTLAIGESLDDQTEGGKHRVRVWDLKTGKVKIRFPEGKGWLFKLLFTSDGNTLLIAGVDPPVMALKLPSGEKIRAYGTNTGPYHDVALSPDERWVAVSDDDLQTVKVLSRERARVLSKFKAVGSFFHGFQFTPDSNGLLTEDHNLLRLWDIRSGKPRLTIPLEHDSSRKAHLSPDGKRIALTNVSEDIMWLDARTGTMLPPWKGCVERVSALSFSRDSKAVVSGDWGVVRVWDALTGKILQQPSGPSQICYGLEFSADGKTAVAASYNGLYFLDSRTLVERCHIPITMGRHECPNYRFAAAVSPNGCLAAFLGEKDEIVLVDARNPTEKRMLRRSDWLPASLAFSGDGTRLYVAGHKSHGLRVWDLQTGKEGRPLDDNLLPMSNLVVANQAQTLAIVVKGERQCCRFWDLQTGKEKRSFKITQPPESYGPEEIMLSDDGKVLAGYYRRSHITVWDVSRQLEIRRFEVGVEGVHWTLSRDGRFLITARDHVLRTVRIADGKQVSELRGHREGSGIVALAVSPLDDGLVSSDTECSMLRWKPTAWQGKRSQPENRCR